jgi:hypothetical protein
MTLFTIFLVLLGLSMIPAAILAVRAYLKYRGTHLITCPETCEPAAVRVNKGHAAATTFVGGPELRLESCTRWPEKQHCGQGCLAQVEAAPAEWLVRNILVHWYDDASCAICGQPISRDPRLRQQARASSARREDRRMERRGSREAVRGPVDALRGLLELSHREDVSRPVSGSRDRSAGTSEHRVS